MACLSRCGGPAAIPVLECTPAALPGVPRAHQPASGPARPSWSACIAPLGQPAPPQPLSLSHTPLSPPPQIAEGFTGLLHESEQRREEGAGPLSVGDEVTVVVVSVRGEKVALSQRSAEEIEQVGAAAPRRGALRSRGRLPRRRAALLPTRPASPPPAAAPQPLTAPPCPPPHATHPKSFL